MWSYEGNQAGIGGQSVELLGISWASRAMSPGGTTRLFLMDWMVDEDGLIKHIDDAMHKRGPVKGESWHTIGEGTHGEPVDARPSRVHTMLSRRDLFFSADLEACPPTDLFPRVMALSVHIRLPDS